MKSILRVWEKSPSAIAWQNSEQSNMPSPTGRKWDSFRLGRFNCPNLDNPKPPELRLFLFEKHTKNIYFFVKIKTNT